MLWGTEHNKLYQFISRDVPLHVLYALKSLSIFRERERERGGGVVQCELFMADRKMVSNKVVKEEFC